MRLVSLILLFIVPFSLQNGLDASVETTNAYLRSFLPWWPKTEEFTLRAAPTLVDPKQNATEHKEDVEGSGTVKEDEAKTEKEEKKEDVVDASSLRVQSLPASPLDEFSPAAVARNPPSHDGNFIINFDEMSECPRDCSTDLREALGIVLEDMSHIERYHRLCEKYKNATICVNEDARCNSEDRGMFEMMTSGFHYMCIEQELAFNATIKCIDDEAGLVQSECENQCQTKNMFMNWIMRSTMQNTIQQGVNDIVGAATGTNPNPLAFLQSAGANGQPGAGGWADMLGNIGNPPNPETAQQGFENFRQFTNDLCRIGDCMLDCIRSKFNTRCEGSAGTLLSEVFVRPIAVSQNKLQMLRPVMGMFMPEQCAYLHSNSDLQKHRIGSTMDEELKRMYAEKAAKEVRDRAAQDELLSNLVPLDKNGVPLPHAIPGLEPADSPLDISVKTLDQLILDMYSKNESKALNISEKNNVTATFLNEPEEKETTTTTTTATTSSVVVAATNTTSEEASGVETDDVEVSGASGSSGDVSESSGTENASGEASGESSGASEVSEPREATDESSGTYETSGDVEEHSGTTFIDEGESSGSSGAYEEVVEASGASGESSGYSNDDVPLLVTKTTSSEEASGVNGGDVEYSEASGASGELDESSGTENASSEGSGVPRSHGDVFEFPEETSGEEMTSGSFGTEDQFGKSVETSSGDSSGELESSKAYYDDFESSGASGDQLASGAVYEGSSEASGAEEDATETSGVSLTSSEHSSFYYDVVEQSGKHLDM